jgi:protein TonB
MAYVDQNMGKERTVAAVVTAAILIVVGYLFYTGLALNVLKKAGVDLKVLDIKDQPPPPPKKPPPPPPKAEKPVTPPIVAPPPLVQPPVQTPPPVAVVPVAPPAPPIVNAPVAVAPPAPPKPSQASGAKPRGTPGEWVTSDDYPPGALRNEEQGRTGFTLDIGADGRVTNCTVTSSSGFPDLDQTACKLLPRRARFTPAKDSAGNGIASTYTSSVRWQIPKD